jgi:hypothetical protein
MQDFALFASVLAHFWDVLFTKGSKCTASMYQAIFQAETTRNFDAELVNIEKCKFSVFLAHFAFVLAHLWAQLFTKGSKCTASMYQAIFQAETTRNFDAELVHIEKVRFSVFWHILRPSLLICGLSCSPKAPNALPQCTKQYSRPKLHDLDARKLIVISKYFIGYSILW